MTCATKHEVGGLLTRLEAQIDSRLRVIEGALETQVAQNTQLHGLIQTLDAKVQVLGDENRQWRRHVERLMRQKEALLEAHGVRRLEDNHRSLVGQLVNPAMNAYWGGGQPPNMAEGK